MKTKIQPADQGPCCFGTTNWMYGYPGGWAAKSATPRYTYGATWPGNSRGELHPRVSGQTAMHNQESPTGGGMRVGWVPVFVSLLALCTSGSGTPFSQPVQNPEFSDGAASTLHVSERLLRSQAIKIVLPQYPTQARQKGIHGILVVAISVNAQGKVVRAAARSAEPLLAESSIKAALHSNFRPYVLNGLPVPVSGRITYEFRSTNRGSGDVTLRPIP
jgi:TonB family protein